MRKAAQILHISKNAEGIRMVWVQLYVKAPNGSNYTTPEAMKRVDDHLVQQLGAAFCCQKGLPIQGVDGTWEVRVFSPATDLTVDLVKYVLTMHYGLEIVREVAHE